MADNSSTIQTNANKPKKATVDGNTVEQHSIADQILANDYERAAAANGSRKRGFALARLKPGGTVN